MNAPSLFDLLRDCTVRIEPQPGQTKYGTGFFVGPGTILTCAHVIGGASSVKVFWAEQHADATVIAVRNADWPDVGIVRLTEPADHASVLLDSDVRPGDELYSFGYTDTYREGDPITATAEGLSTSPKLIKFKQAQVRPGLSGSPLLNLRTGGVCGVVKLSRDRETDLGGRGVATSTVLEEFNELALSQGRLHRRDSRWMTLLAPAQQDRFLTLPDQARHVVTAFGYAPRHDERPALALYWRLQQAAGPVNPYGRWRLRSPTGAAVRSAAYQPPRAGRTHGSLFIGLDADQGVYRSTDLGLSWHEISIGLGCTSINQIRVSSLTSAIFAATDDGLWMSRDSGGTWAQQPPFSGMEILTVLLSADDPNFLSVGSRAQGGTSIASATAGAAAIAGTDVGPAVGLRGGHFHLRRHDSDEWRTFPIATVNDAALSIHDNRVGYLASIDGGLWVTSNQFETIRSVESLRKVGPMTVAFPRDDESMIAVGARDGLFLTKDQGRSWTLADGIGSQQVAQILFVDGSHGHILAATATGIYESTDAGRTWNSNNEGLDYRWSMALAQAGADIYAGTSGGGVYRRTVRSRTWSVRNAGLPTISLATITHFGNSLVGGGPGVHMSGDGAQSWKVIGLDGETVWSVAVVAADPETFTGSSLAGAGRAFRVSNTAGRSWRTQNEGRYIVLAGTSDSIYRHDSDDASWSQLHRFSGGRLVRHILVAPRRPSEIVVSVDGAGTYRSPDFGDHWERVAGEGVLALSIADTLLLGTPEGALLRSSDGGTTWNASSSVFEDPIIALASAPGEGTVYCVSRRGRILRSDELANDFTVLGEVPIPDDPNWATFGLPPHRDRLVLGTSRGAYESRDGGQSWNRIDGGLLAHDYHVNSIAIADNGGVFAAMREGVFVLDAK